MVLSVVIYPAVVTWCTYISDYLLIPNVAEISTNAVQYSIYMAYVYEQNNNNKISKHRVKYKQEFNYILVVLSTHLVCCENGLQSWGWGAATGIKILNYTEEPTPRLLESSVIFTASIQDAATEDKTFIRNTDATAVLPHPPNNSNNPPLSTLCT